MTQRIEVGGHMPTILAGVAWTFLVLCETLAQVALKAAGSAMEGVPPEAWLWAAATNGWAWIGVIGYLGSFAAWMTILDRMPLSLGFPLTSIVYVSVTAASAVLFGEHVGALRWAGVAIIIAGIVLLGTEDD